MSEHPRTTGKSPSSSLSLSAERVVEEARRLAEQIVNDLFTNGSGARAVRLVMIDGQGRDLGGWSAAGAASRIHALLAQEGSPR